MPEIFKIFWSLEVLGYLIFSGVHISGKEYIINILYSTIWKIPRICLRYITFGVKSLGYSKFHNLENFQEYYITFSVKSLEYVCIGHSRKVSRLWDFEYPMHIPEILH